MLCGRDRHHYGTQPVLPRPRPDRPAARASHASRRASAPRTAARGRLADIRPARPTGPLGGRPSPPAPTSVLPAELALSAAVFAARPPDDRFACLEQPDRDGFALAGLGAAMVLEAHGPDRFHE